VLLAVAGAAQGDEVFRIVTAAVSERDAVVDVQVLLAAADAA
jgi:hypothetical protein